MASTALAPLQTVSSCGAGCTIRTARASSNHSAYFGARLPLGNAGKRSCRSHKGAAVAALRSVNASEVGQLIADGYKVIDVRDERQYAKAHIKNSEHIPLFVENKANDPKTLILRLLHQNYVGLLYGNLFTKPNPGFDAKIKQIPKDQKVLLVCQEGLRSGQAADELDDQGWEDLAFIGKGLNDLKPGLVEKEGPNELRDAGKGGISQYQQPASIVVGSILITLIALLQFFPEQMAPYVRQVFENGA